MASTFTINPTSGTIADVVEGYSRRGTITITVTNTAPVPIRVDYPNDAVYTCIDNDSGDTYSDIRANGSATALLQPVTGLPAGDYSDTLLFEDIANHEIDSFNVSFTVTAYVDSISASPVNLDWGELVEGATFPSKTVTITNNGTQTCTLVDVSSDYYVMTGFGSISPGGNRVITITPYQYLGPDDYSGTINFQTTKSGLAPVHTDLTVVDAVYSITINPVSLTFASVIEGYSRPASQTVTLTNAGNTTQTVEFPPSDYYTITDIDGNTTATLNASESVSVYVQPVTNLWQGNYNQTRQFIANNAAASLTLSFSVTPATYVITATPDTLDFGSIISGGAMPAAQTVAISNTGNANVTATPVTTTGFICSPASIDIAPNSSGVFTVTPDANVTGNYNGSIDFIGTGDSFTSVGVFYSVHPVTYNASVTPVAYTYTAQQIGYTNLQDASFTVTNTGTGNIHITASIPSYFTVMPTTANISAGNSQIFVITVKPGLSVREYTERVYFLDVSHLISVSTILTFQVIPQTTYGIAVSPSALDFGTLSTGYVPTAQYVQITNTGTMQTTVSLPAAPWAIISGNSDIPVGESTTIAVIPKANLPAGVYTNQLVFTASGGVSGSCAISVNVTEQPAPVDTVTFSLYRTPSATNALTKTLNDGITMTGTFRDAVGVVTPTVTIETDVNISTYNYAHIAIFSRYYFIRGITAVRAGLWQLELKCDVLMSYAADIRALSGIVARNSNEYNALMVDTLYPIPSRKTKTVYTIPDLTPTPPLGDGFDTSLMTLSTFNYVITTAAGGN